MSGKADEAETVTERIARLRRQACNARVMAQYADGRSYRDEMAEARRLESLADLLEREMKRESNGR